MKAYSTREVADLLGLSRQRVCVRSCARASSTPRPRRRAAAPRSRSRISCCCARPRGSRDANVSAAPDLESAARAREAAADRSAASRRPRADRRRSRDRARQQQQLGAGVRPDACSTSRSASSARKSRRSRATRCSERCVRASSADDLFHGALESEQIGANDDAEAAYRGVLEPPSPRTSPRVSTSAVCATPRARSTRPSGCTARRSSSIRITRPRGSISASCSRIVARRARRSKRTSKPCDSTRASRTCTSISRGCISRPATAGRATPLLALQSLDARRRRIALLGGALEKFRGELRPRRRVLVLEEHVGRRQRRGAEAREPRVEIRRPCNRPCAGAGTPSRPSTAPA